MTMTTTNICVPANKFKVMNNYYSNGEMGCIEKFHLIVGAANQCHSTVVPHATHEVENK